ncbi:MAG: hypothetical protein L0G99_12210 [Propionibacteriales bacterium]|nr:hypothetical protein [Propionibacteriales bacterium]
MSTPGTSTPSTTMGITNTLVRLKVTLLRNGLRRSVWKTVGLVIGGLYGLGVVLLVVTALFALRFAEAELAAAVTTTVFTLMTVGWILMPLLVFGQDDTVDPARFALLPVPAGRLVRGLAMGALIGLPGLGTVLAAVGLLGTWSNAIAPFIAAVVVLPIGVLLCVLWSRAALTWMSALLAGRRTRDLSVVLLMVLMLGLALGAQFLPRMVGDQAQMMAAVDRTADILGWTPFGWIWSVPGLVAAGDWGLAILRLVLSLALVVALAWLWRVRLAVAMTSPPDAGQQRTNVRSGALAGLLPDTPAGAVALRCLLYWRRDPRYMVALVSLLLTPVLRGAVALTTGATALTPWAALLVTWLVGSSVGSELAYDSSALALHVLTGVRGVDDRIGRAIAYLIIGAPIALVTAVAGAVLSGHADLLPRVLAIGVASLLGGLGFGLWLGTRIPGKAPKPGANPLSSGESGGLKSMLVLFLSTTGTMISALPAIALVVLSFIGPDWWQWVALGVGIVSGVLCLRAGTRVGGRVLDRRWPEILSEVS